MPAKQQNYARFTKEVWGGLNIHTYGFGLNISDAKFKTYKKKILYTFDIVGMQHEKEYKIFGSIDENAKLITGKIGKDLNLDEGYKAAERCGLSIVAHVKNACGGDLDKVKSCIKLTGYVNSTDEYPILFILAASIILVLNINIGDINL